MRDTILGDHAIRLGFCLIKGLCEEEMERLVERRDRGYDSVRDLWLRAGLPLAALEGLADADAFRSLGLDRRAALWAVRGLNRAGDKDDLPLFAGPSGEREPDAHLPPLRLGEHVVEDYRTLTLSLKAHPVSFLRDALTKRHVLRGSDLATIRDGRRATVAGLVLVRQRPGSAKGTVFLTIEDETGVANVIVWPKIFEANRAAVIGSRLLGITGRVQNESGVVHVVAERFEDLTAMLDAIGTAGPPVSNLARADEVKRPQTYLPEGGRHGKVLGAKIGFPLAANTRKTSEEPAPAPLAVGDVRRAMPKGRNFH